MATSQIHLEGAYYCYRYKKYAAVLSERQSIDGDSQETTMRSKVRSFIAVTCTQAKMEPISFDDHKHNHNALHCVKNLITRPPTLDTWEHNAHKAPTILALCLCTCCKLPPRYSTWPAYGQPSKATARVETETRTLREKCR